MKYNLKAIACVGKRGELGVDNHLIWQFKQDMAFFKAKTTDNIVIMGSKTFESLGNRGLPNRENIVLTRKYENYYSSIHKATYMDWNNVMRFINEYEGDKDIYVIGGEQIYGVFMQFIDTIYLTEVNDICRIADSYFPMHELVNFRKQELFSNRVFNFKINEYKRTKQLQFKG